ncbi:autophagy protein 13 [Rhodotorula toruloides]
MTKKTEQAKADQLVQQFYAKTCAIVSQARLTHVVDDPAYSPTSLASPVPGDSTPSIGPSAASGTRKPSGKERGRKTNKWFNLELPDNDLFRAELRTWRNVSHLLSATPSPSSSAPYSAAPSSISSSQPHIPPMVLEVVLDVSDLTPNQVHVLSDQKGRRIRVDGGRSTSGAGAHARSGATSPLPISPGVRSPRSAGGPNVPAPPVVLERWVLSLHPPSHPSPSSSYSSPSPSASTAATQIELPTVYKHSILHFRTLFSLVRALPAYSLQRKLAKRRAGVGGAGLKIAVRTRAGLEDEAREGEVGIEVPIEGSGRDGDTRERGTEKIVFPGVATPFGTLSLDLTYRTNTDFSVEEIETLLSSRFIDEDFFRPTVARYSSAREEVRPGSLPISASRAGGGFPSTSPAHASPPAGPGKGMTGLGPLPSYGSLSSRHQYAPVLPSTSPHQPHTSSPLAPSPRPPNALPSPLHAPVPVRATTSPVPLPASGSSPRPESAQSATSSRYSYPHSVAAVAGTSAPTGAAAGAVEPAFISLSRARAPSFSGAGGAGGIERASPSSVPRRPSMGSSGASGSPIFRPGSYFTSAAAAGGLSSSPSYSYGPITRQQPLASTSGASPSSQLSSGISPRSPLVPQGAAAPSPRPIPAPSSSPYAGTRAYSYSSQPAGIFGSQGSYTASRSYGRGGSSGGSGEWGGPESLGAGASGIARPRASSRLSFGAAGSPGVAGVRGTSRLGTMMRQHDEARARLGVVGGAAEEKKRFINEGGTPDDADDINTFLSMLDSKPDLRGLEASRSITSGEGAFAASGVGKSGVLSKKDVDEQLRQLKTSVYGAMGEGGESPSPPPFGLGLSGGPSPGQRASSALSGISNLRRQTSRLSIEEDPVAEQAALVAAQRDRTTSGERSSPAEAGLAAVLEKTPRAGHRALKRDALVSPALSATSSSTAQPPPLAIEPALAQLDPRFLPLPTSSATSPLASPGTHPHPPFPSIGPLGAQPYPPLPYPPAGTPTSALGRTEPITFAPYISRASRQPLNPPAGDGGSGFASTIVSEHNSGAASISSFYTQEGDGDEGVASSDRGEEEAVGRLELDDSPVPEDMQRRGRAWGLALGSGEVDEEEISLASAGAQHSRDPTPAAGRLGNSGGGARPSVGAGYFASRSHSRGGGSPPWM